MERLGRFFGAFLSVILLMGSYSIAEDITLTTYYPAPYGEYDELRSGKVGIGLTTADTVQNKLDVEGGVAIGASYSGTNAAPADGLIVQGQVGIGTTSPTAGTVLDANGTINATTYSVGATPGAATTTITYVKTVNFITQTVTTGTITVINGIVTVIN